MGYIQDSTEGNSHGTYFYVFVFYVGVSFLAFALNLLVFRWDKLNRENLLQSIAPLEEFERYTVSKMSEARVSAISAARGKKYGK